MVDNLAYLDEPEDETKLRCSPRRSRCAEDTSGVYVDEREGAGRFLRVSRAVRRGEAILVEEPLFITPASAQEIQAFLAEVCDDGVLRDIAAAAPPPVPGEHWPPWLPLPELLALVVVQALVEADSENPRFDAFRDLHGDTERWSEQAHRLWGMLNEQYRGVITAEAVCEVYGIVSANSHATDGGRAAIFALGSMAEHSCAPSAFKEVIVPADVVSRPGSPCCEAREPLSPPTSPCRSPGPWAGAAPARPQLVIRAQTDLDEDDIVSISYISEYLPTWMRREQLHSGYGFICTCPRCEREPEAVCAFICQSCGDGPCFPTAPVTSASGYAEQSFRCEECDLLTNEEQIVATYTAAEQAEVVTQELLSILHPFHWKVYGMYLHNLKDIPASSRAQVVDQLSTAQQRLCKSDSHPLLGRFSELAGSAHLEAGEQQQAAASFRRAQELYGISHRGPPDCGHQARCYREQTRCTPSTGVLGTLPRRLSRVAGTLGRSPSLPSLAEGVAEES